MADKLETIRDRLQSVLLPRHLEIRDESHLHSKGLETHYKVTLVSERFAGLSRVRRHQQVYGAMGELMTQIHALALHLYTPEEWQALGAAPASPTCGGGGQ